MPTVTAGSKVLVSGATGFIAVWVIQTLLEKGYSVRGTVRSLDKGAYLKKKFASYGDKFELFVVKDIGVKGAFDEAVKGVDAIEHTASPFHFQADDPEEVIRPAVDGTVGILESALKNGSSVKRIVITSSTVAVGTFEKPDTLVFTEADWNETAVQLVKESGKNAHPGAKYSTSKTLAEKAAWDFYNKHKSSIQWELVVLNPPFVFGPVIHEVSSVDGLNTSAHEFYQHIVSPNTNGKSNEALATEGYGWVDVRDVADAHVLALQKEEAGGERFLLSGGSFVWQNWIDTANSLNPSPIPSKTLPKGNPGAGKDAPKIFIFDSSKASRILGIKFRTQEETTRDTLADFEAKGW